MKRNNYSYTIKDLKLFGYHGVYDNEIKNGQYFYITVKYSILEKSISNDKIHSSFDYSEVVEEIKNCFNIKRYNLIELLASDIHSFIMNKFNFSNLHIIIKKKKPSIDNKVKYIAVDFSNE